MGVVSCGRMVGESCQLEEEHRDLLRSLRSDYLCRLAVFRAEHGKCRHRSKWLSHQGLNYTPLHYIHRVRVSSSGIDREVNTAWHHSNLVFASLATNITYPSPPAFLVFILHGLFYLCCRKFISASTSFANQTSLSWRASTSSRYCCLWRSWNSSAHFALLCLDSSVSALDSFRQ